jgi:hypothetical protein
VQVGGQARRGAGAPRPGPAGAPRRRGASVLSQAARGAGARAGECVRVRACRGVSVAVRPGGPAVGPGPGPGRGGHPLPVDRGLGRCAWRGVCANGVPAEALLWGDGPRRHAPGRRVAKASAAPSAGARAGVVGFRLGRGQAGRATWRGGSAPPRGRAARGARRRQPRCAAAAPGTNMGWGWWVGLCCAVGADLGGSACGGRRRRALARGREPARARSRPAARRARARAREGLRGRRAPVFTHSTPSSGAGQAAAAARAPVKLLFVAGA